MIIAVSIKKPDLHSDIADVFGRSKYFLIHNSINNVYEILDNPFVSELGGAGILTASLLISKYVEVLITKNIGLNPLRLFNSANVKILYCESVSAADAIQLYFNNRLNSIENDNRNSYRRRNQNRYGNYKINNNRKCT
jgi:predicted Fe-Mo cluster-binding NifX family protein